MAFSPKELLERLYSKGANLQCPFCKRAEWSWDGSLRILMKIDPSNRAIEATNDLIPGLPLLCGNCGYIALFNSIRLGVSLDEL